MTLPPDLTADRRCGLGALALAVWIVPGVIVGLIAAGRL